MFVCSEFVSGGGGVICVRIKRNGKYIQSLDWRCKKWDYVEGDLACN